MTSKIRTINVAAPARETTRRTRPIHRRDCGPSQSRDDVARQSHAGFISERQGEKRERKNLVSTSGILKRARERREYPHLMPYSERERDGAKREHPHLAYSKRDRTKREHPHLVCSIRERKKKRASTFGVLKKREKEKGGSKFDVLKKREKEKGASTSGVLKKREKEKGASTFGVL